MIYYYSATGNSRFVAKILGAGTYDECCDIVEMNKKGVLPDIVHSGEALGVVFPIYAWNVPKIMLDFIKKLQIEEGAYVYAVATCGGETGLAVKRLKEVLPLNAGFSVLMPDGYIILFDAPKTEASEALISEAKANLKDICRRIVDRENVLAEDRGALAFIKSYIIPPFFKLIVKDKSFRAEENCISCGLCEEVCPVNNIKLVDGKPVWQGGCTHCCACINRCSVRAIQYGKGTKEKGRYYLGEEE